MLPAATHSSSLPSSSMRAILLDMLLASFLRLLASVALNLQQGAGRQGGLQAREWQARHRPGRHQVKEQHARGSHRARIHGSSYMAHVASCAQLFIAMFTMMAV